jgi:hypothetical protein
MSKKRSRSKQSAAKADGPHGSMAGQMKKRDHKRQKASKLPPWETDEYARSLRTLGDYRKAVRDPKFSWSLFPEGRDNSVYEATRRALGDVKGLLQRDIEVVEGVVADYSRGWQTSCCFCSIKLLHVIRLLEFAVEYKGKSRCHLPPGWPEHLHATARVFDAAGFSCLEASLDFVRGVGKHNILELQWAFGKNHKGSMYAGPFKWLEATPAVNDLQISPHPDESIERWLGAAIETLRQTYNLSREREGLEGQFNATRKELADERKKWEETFKSIWEGIPEKYRQAIEQFEAESREAQEENRRIRVHDFCRRCRLDEGAFREYHERVRGRRRREKPRP